MFSANRLNEKQKNKKNMPDIIVISDIHVSRKWDSLKNVFPKKVTYLNPNKYLRKVIAEIKKEDRVVFNGDLIDYYYSDYSRNGGNNWKIFFDIIKKIKGRCYFNTGNHDYRKSPYNFSIYGLRHVNISNLIRKKYGKRIGFSKFRYIKELKSIEVNLEKFNPLPKKITASKKNVLTSNGELLLLNTGPDALTKFKNFFRLISWPSILSSYPASTGLSNKDIEILTKRAGEKTNRELFIFIHCPPFFARKKISPIRLSPKFYALRMVFSGLTFTAFSKNNWPFVSQLLASKRNITVVASHSHIPKEYIVDKKSKLLKESTLEEINHLRKKSRYIKFVNTLPLGAVKPMDKIGYLRINKNKITSEIIEDFKKIDC